ncbi:MAG TPA: hypothetical protein VFU21_09610, partial [Kofleriaceae bacterium]|nr:hypothetical protein [Kofleriaceae bacterium]
MRRALCIVFMLTGCGAGSVEPDDPARQRSARSDTGLSAPDRGRPAPQRVARAIQSVPRDETPDRRLCEDPSFQGGDLIIGGERVRLMSTCPT